MRLVHSHHVAAAPLGARAMSLLPAVSPVRLRTVVEKLAHPRHARAQAEANRRAAAWIAAEFSACGYAVEFQGSYRNVIALPPGEARPLTLVCSHYDTVPETPGADDNASAVAAMLEVARVLRGAGLPAGFASFNGEEDGLLGSTDFVQDWIPRHPRRIAGAHVLEMVGFCSHAPGSQRVPPELPIQLPDRGDFLGLLANRDSAALLDRSLAAARAALPDFPVVGLEVPAGAEQFLPVLLRSDHAPFWEARLPAVMWTDTSEFRNPHYHQPTDTAATLDFSFLARVTQVLVASLCGDAG